MAVPLTQNRLRRSAAFSVAEVLLTLVVLVIVSRILIPQFTSAASESRDATLKDALRYLRTQITVYKSQHHDVAPGYANGDAGNLPDAASFVAQLTHYSDEQGRVSSTQFPVHDRGPYLTEIPENPVSSQSGVLVVTGASMPEPDPSQPYGWIYNPQTCQIVPNLSGSDDNGIAYSSY